MQSDYQLSVTRIHCSSTSQSSLINQSIHSFILSFYLHGSQRPQNDPSRNRNQIRTTQIVFSGTKRAAGGNTGTNPQAGFIGAYGGYDFIGEVKLIRVLNVGS
ncbi:hypothetical protein BT96DRAFT_109496 [Gymnopus androsaceus JB14]|uniref:Uncharacterized protein n=1 Tax=Gymnopus androsaceus JB14 TaxID=1447944 RepID=A0A6A4HDR8_9AGAR|nr:hypothetical protein BT96DRAFT_109496 [Gymnopus androsaceus JB14]